jgi:membrane protein implicated in regulation of membrane protease activity
VSATGGRVKIGGDVWSARSESGVLTEGQRVIVAAIDGATAVVAPQAETAIQ